VLVTLICRLKTYDIIKKNKETLVQVSRMLSRSRYVSSFESLMPRVEVFRFVMPCSVSGFENFRGPCYSHLQGKVAGRRRNHLAADCHSVLVSSPFWNSRPDVNSVEICVFSCLGASSLMG
jgi:hypothetical protein